MVLIRDVIPAEATLEHLRLERGDLLVLSLTHFENTHAIKSLAEDLPPGVILIVLPPGVTFETMPRKDLEDILRRRPPAEPA